MIDFATVAATATVSALAQTAVYLLIRRSQELRDAEVKEMKEDVKELREKELGGIKGEIARASASRKEIYLRMERDLVKRAECERQHAAAAIGASEFQKAVVRLEHVATKADNAIERIEQLSAQQYQLARELSAVAAGGSR